MRVPVLLVLPSKKLLQESATAAAKRKRPTDISKVRRPSMVKIDTSFHAVPFATGQLEESPSLAKHAPSASEKFVVRGHVEVDKLEDIPSESEGHPIFADPHIAPFITCGGTPPVGAAAGVATKLNVSALAAKGLDGKGVAIAVMDTGINLAHLTTKLGFAPKFDAANSWTPPGTTIPPGNHPVDHGTMCAFDALIAAPKATLLDFPILSSSSPGGSTMSGTLGVALLGFAQLLAFWAVAFAPAAPKYKALISTNSWGIFHPSWDFPVGHPGRFLDNPNHPFNVIVATLARSAADIAFAAGNCGAQCADGRCQGRTNQAIMGASALADVLTLAGCDTNDQRVGYASQGPSIAGMYQQKPDVTSYTHFKGSEAFGPGSPDSGTSAACPVAAGCVAALRTKVLPKTVSPAQMIVTLRQTARAVPGPAGWNGDYGYGIINPLAAATSCGV
jgi:Subtilase family